MKILNRILSLSAMVLLILLLCLSTAVNIGATTRTGTVDIALHALDGATGEGSMTVALYKVADRVNSEYVLTEDFADAGVDVRVLDDADGMAATLYRYIAAHDIAHERLDVSIPGSARFDNVSEGLYLLVSEGDHNGVYEPFSPFLLSMPYVEEGQTEATYHLSCEPKLELSAVPTPSETITPTQPATQPVTETVVPTVTPVPAETKLPQTGMIRWYVPALSVIGLLLFALGWALRFTGNR